jgi:hypothetical protein
LASLEAFVDRLSRALVDFDRARHGQLTKRTGRRSSREELVVGFRVVSLKPGSAIMELEPSLPDEQAEIVHAETLAMENFRALLNVIEDKDEPLDPDVTQSVEAARRALGIGGRIGVLMTAEHAERRILIDEARVDELASRRPKREKLVTQISGRLTMVDIEPPFRVAIRATNGAKWNCRYPPELEPRVTQLLKKHVVARGAGVAVSQARGYFEIEQLEELEEFSQTELFTVERVPLEALVREKRLHGAQGWDAFADPNWEDDESSEAYLEALLRHVDGS